MPEHHRAPSLSAVFSLAVLFLLLLPLVAGAEATETPASVAELEWLVGHWRGELGGGTIEEYWSTTGGGAIMGSFRWFTEDEVRFYEFILIEPSPTGPVLRIKHFNPGLQGWEEKNETVDFHLAEHRDGLAVFERDPAIEDSQLVYTLKSEGVLEVQLIKNQDGKESVMTFSFNRQ
ncbi:MAG: DUF6265 family protein [Acidobacteriota bacterium]